MLELSNIRKSFGDKLIIASVTLSLAAGKILCLTGPSGVGKTTLMEIMAGVTDPDKGTVRRSTDAALMFQDDVLIPWLTAEKAITYIMPSSIAPQEQKKHAVFWLEKYGLEPDMYPAAMSGGMRRRLSLARTFAANRRLIFLDEPFAFLDKERCCLVAEDIACHAEAGCGIVLTSHTTTPLEHQRFSLLSIRCMLVEHAPIVIDGNT